MMFNNNLTRIGSIFYVTYLLQTTLHSVNADVYFKYGNDFTCDYPVSVSVTGSSCSEGGDVCTFGDSIDAYGVIKLKEALPTKKLCLSTKMCFNGYNWLCKTVEDVIDGCSSFNMVGVNGQTCPAAGEYTFDASVTLPSNNAMTLTGGWWILSTTTATDCEFNSGYSFSCTSTVHAVNVASSSSSSHSAYIAGAAVLVGSIMSLFFIRRRRTLRTTLDLTKEEQLMDGQDNFEMMTDAVRV